MQVQHFVTRLQERLQSLQLREIDSAAGLDAAMRGNLAAPAAYVIPLSERGTELPTTGPLDQLERRVIGVLYVIDTRAPSGGAGLTDLASLRAATKQALIGWVADDTTGEPVVFLGGELVQMEGDGRLVWSDEFLETGYYRSNP
ncbi:hypothetical protein AVHY2522_19245 [Acidovorax sp. SUPP2522]|uniref:phage tail terminator protein n=1 Tax=unclassified Acidovorax TaxID=2684926 RepID=UPI00234B4ABA|nr:MULTISPECIES: hypothetical protein [unclassified Acidovorax]WCM99981.1 hypothetical protein M5C96_11600 [Acidovorax sp. GBBC 1281]GKT18554.1 hypothetical protein AVHY2522_19245 [Acidovorax sp. SUPP2522]